MDGSYQHKKEARAISYLKDAVQDLGSADDFTESKNYSASLFYCQQSCEKAMKACLVLQGVLLAEEHYNISKYFNDQIIPNTKHELKSELKEIINKVKNVEWYYVPTRYSVTKEGEVYLREFSEKETQEAFNITQNLLQLCFKFIENWLNKKLAKEKNLSLEELKKKKLEVKLPRDKEGLINYLKKNYKDVVRIS